MRLRPKITPKRCAHCGKRSAFYWTVRLCADRSRKRRIELCVKCDAMLNELTLNFARARGRAAKMRAYRKRTGDVIA